MKTWIAMALALAAASSSSSSSWGAADEAPKPPAEMEQLKALAGNWKCETKTEAMPGRPARTSRSTYAAKLELDGFWLVAVQQEEKSKDNPLPWHSVTFWGYDPATKLFVSRFMGINHLTGSGQSKGWEGDDMTWNDEAKIGGQMLQERVVFQKDKTGKTITLKGELLAGSTWTPAFTTTCKK